MLSFVEKLSCLDCVTNMFTHECDPNPGSGWGEDAGGAVFLEPQGWVQTEAIRSHLRHSGPGARSPCHGQTERTANRKR